MAKNVRLSESEQEMLFRTSVNVNRELVRIGARPLRESEIVHKILEQTLKYGEIEVTRDGQIRVIANELNEKSQKTSNLSPKSTPI